MGSVQGNRGVPSLPRPPIYPPAARSKEPRTRSLRTKSSETSSGAMDVQKEETTPEEANNLDNATGGTDHGGEPSS